MRDPQPSPDDPRERLIEHALSLIEERGSAALTMPELAARAGVSAAHIARHFPSHEALIEAIAEHWFRPKLAAMDAVMASGLPPRRKMFEFFARRFALMRAAWERDPALFAMHAAIGAEHFEQVRSYVDLADHYLGEIIGEAMGEGHFAGLSIDEAISLVNQMVAVYCNIGAMVYVMPRLSEEKLARIIDAIFDGLSGQDRGARGLTGLRAA